MYRACFLFCKTLVLLCLSILGGCATSQVWFAPSVTPGATLTPEHGYIALTVINASTAPLPFNHVTLTPKNINTSKDAKAARIQALEEAPNSSTVFFSSLPEGEYTLTDLRGFYSLSDRWYSRWASSKDPVGNFSITKGKITDLGKIIVYPRVVGDRFHYLIVRVPDSHALADVPPDNIRADMDTRNVITWDDDGGDSERQSLYANIAQNPVIYNDRYISPLGNLYLVGKLGFIMKRTAAGIWENDAVETDFDLNSVYESKAGALVVGGDFGKVFIKHPKSEWQDISIPSNMSVDAITAAEDNRLIVIAHNPKTIKIFARSIAEASQPWSVLATLDPESGWQNADQKFFYLKPYTGNHRRLKRVVHNARLIEFNNDWYIASSLQLGKELNFIAATERYLHRVTDNFTTLVPVGDFNEGIDNVLNVGEGYLGINYPGFFKTWTTYYRLAAGETVWEKVSTKVDLCKATGTELAACNKNSPDHATAQDSRSASFEFTSSPVFFNGKDAYAIVKFTRQPKDIKGSYVPIASTDGGQSWFYSTKPLPGNDCIETIPEVHNSILVYCHGQSADFYESDDLGKTWRHVRQSIKF